MKIPNTLFLIMHILAFVVAVGAVPTAFAVPTAWWWAPVVSLCFPLGLYVARVFRLIVIADNSGGFQDLAVIISSILGGSALSGLIFSGLAIWVNPVFWWSAGVGLAPLAFLVYLRFYPRSEL